MASISEADIGSRLLARAREVGGQELSAVCDDALARAPAALRDLIDIGNIARDQGLFEQADRIYEHILRTDPGFVFAHYELAVSLMRRNELVKALQALDDLCTVRPGDGRGQLLAARILYAMHCPDLALQRLDRIAAGELDAGEIRKTMEFGNYLTEFPSAHAIYLSSSLERSSRYLHARQLYEAVRDALAERRGFSVVRVGDGEGAFTVVSPADEAKYAYLYADNRLDRANVWFNGEIDLKASGFLSQAFRLAEQALAVSDVVGMPYTGWVTHEYNILSFTGVPGLVNPLRIAARLPHQRICSQFVHVHLKHDGLLEALMREQTHIGLISCHSQLPQAIRSKFGLEVDFYKIPGEKLMRGMIGAEAAGGNHFPEVFEQTMKALARPHKGKLFLVAGGILGKFYCAQIKQHGGVALDIGSIADAWVGAATRPGLGSEPQL